MAKVDSVAEKGKVTANVGKNLATNGAVSSPSFSDNGTEENTNQKTSNVAADMVKAAIRPFVIKVVIIVSVVFLLLMILTIIASGAAVFSEEIISPMREEINKVRAEYAEEYNVTIDANMIIAALVAEQEREVYLDLDNIKDEIRLLAKYQITTHINDDCDSSNKRKIASNDDNGLFSSDLSDEKNYYCDSSVGDTYYSVSVENGKFNDDNTGSVFFWNLVDEDFIFDYYQKYVAGERDDPATQEKINSIIKSIYRYYNELNKYSDAEEIYVGISCEAVTLAKDSTGGSYGNLDDAASGNLYLDLDDYVMGVILAGNASDAYTKLGSSREQLLNYYKAMAVTVRSYTLAKTNNCTSPILDSSNVQIYDNPSYYSGTHYYSIVEQAVKDTTGEILINGYKVLSAQYDDFDKNGAYSCGAGYCSNIYTKIPSGEKHVVKVPSDWMSATSANFKSTGKGLSKYGAMHLATQGYDYSLIVSSFYSNNVTFSNVSDLPNNYEVAGEYATWRQTDSRWGSVALGRTNTIKKAGCTCTSIAIQIARSGTETTISDFNPGTMVTAFNRAGLLGYNGSLLSWNAPQQTVAPNFKWVNSVDLKGSVSSKANALQKYLNEGYYMILGVKYKGPNSYGHWVALDRVSNNIIYIFDPAGRGTILYDAYPNDSGADVPLRVIMWKKLD